MMDEEPQPNIKKIITTIDDEKSYSIDVDETTTFYEFKKILAAAAHLLKNCFRIYHEKQEYTNDYDDNTIQEMFPNLDPIPLRIISNKDVYEYEDELISVRFNINVPCQIHIGKYKMMYCFTCNKSICMDCLSEDHKNHKVEEKADYLAPAQLLMNNIFSNSALYRADSRLSKYMESVNFRSNLKLNIFDNLRKLINDLEIKFASCLEYFSTCEDETEKNTNENLELLKKYCIECFIKLKNDINTKGIIIDDEIFLTLYRKLKEIEKYKTEYFEENKFKYEKLNTLLAPFTEQVEKITEQIRLNFQNLLNQNIYENFKNAVQENIVEKIQKETINDFMFRNLGVPRKSLNRMSLGSLTSYKKKEISKGNTYVSPNKVIKEESSPFQKASNLSKQKKNDNTGNIFTQGSFSKTKKNQNEKKSSSKSKTFNKTEEINNRKGFNFNSETNIVSNTFQNNIETTITTTTNINKVSNSLPNNIFGVNFIESLTNAINQTQPGNQFIFMTPIFNTNFIAGALPDETTARIKLDFSKILGEKDLQITSFPNGGAFCNRDNYLYITGGQETQKDLGKLFLRINTSQEDITDIKMIQMPYMIYSHSNHSMISNENYIFVIGGINSNKCEAFNLTTLKWELMPDLNISERQRTILAVYDNYLYAFMGYNQYGILDSVERINIKDLENSKWEMVNTSNPFDLDTKFYGSGIYCLDGEIYFIGGKKGLGNSDNDYKSDVLSYKIDENKFTTKNLNFNGALEFIENQFHRFDEENIGNFSNGKDVLATLPISGLYQPESDL